MDFGLTEEQELLQETLRSFVAGECPVSKLREVSDSESGYDPKIWEALVELGIGGLIIPDEYDGVGMEVLDLALVSEILGEGAVPVPLLGHSMAVAAILYAGSEEQKQKWLPALASGEMLGSIAYAESTDDGEVWEAGQVTTLLKDGKLSGTKRFVPHGQFSDLIVVSVAGGGLAVVDVASAGAKVEPVDSLDRSRPLSSIVFEGTPAEELPNANAETVARVRDIGLVLLAADSFGAAWQLTRMTIEYTKERKQFGTPLAQFQGVKHQIANMATDIDPTRALWWYAAHALDHMADESEKNCALAKAHITERSMEVARSAFELHGGIGYTWECDLQYWFKRTMFNRVFLGTPSEHRARYADLVGW
jgi:alkylation response protein AidB-like acyl-CoA dehydrogenase